MLNIAPPTMMRVNDPFCGIPFLRLYSALKKNRPKGMKNRIFDIPSSWIVDAGSEK
jgi:hypothetical protein